MHQEMKKSKNKNKDDQDFSVNPGNPADHGVDHNISRGTEKDLEDSYIQKQEANGDRGTDNEDDTESKDSEENNRK